MIDNQDDPPYPPSFRHSFRPGELVINSEYGRFNKYLPRAEAETDETYARRMEHAGLAVVITSDELRNFAAFRAATTDATQRELPVMVLTAPAPEQRTVETHDEREKAKRAALAYVRAQPDARQREGGG